MIFYLCIAFLRSSEINWYSIERVEEAGDGVFVSGVRGNDFIAWSW